MKMRKFLLFLPILFFLGCKTVQPTIITRDSVRVEMRLDSIYIYERDSVYVDRWRANDTVYITTEKWRTRYKDKIRLQHDTIVQTKTQTIVQTEKVTPKWAWYCLIACIVLVAGIVVRIIIKIYARR